MWQKHKSEPHFVFKKPQRRRVVYFSPFLTVWEVVLSKYKNLIFIFVFISVLNESLQNKFFVLLHITMKEALNIWKAVSLQTNKNTNNIFLKVPQD